MTERVRSSELPSRGGIDFEWDHAKGLKQRVTIRLDVPTIEYFKAMSEDSGIPYQTLINLYLRDCAESGRELRMAWEGEDG